jgi:hypothetical protein
MARRTRNGDNTSGRTASRQEARANRKLQLVISNTFPGERGLTLLEKMENELVARLEERGAKLAWYQAIANPDEELTDEQNDEYYDWCKENEGVIKGELRMLAIMRSTSAKTELDRARARLQAGIKHGE